MQTRQQIEIEKLMNGRGLERGTWARDARMNVRGEGGADGIEWILTTEQPVLIFDWERWDFVHEVLVADGMLVPGVGRVPLQDNHKRTSFEDTLGHVDGFAEATAGGFEARSGIVHFDMNDEKAVKAREKVEGRHLTDGSVGYTVLEAIWVPEGERVAVDGKIYDGPLKVARSWLLKEFSLTPIGADDLAKKVEAISGA